MIYNIIPDRNTLVYDACERVKVLAEESGSLVALYVSHELHCDVPSDIPGNVICVSHHMDVSGRSLTSAVFLLAESDIPDARMLNSIRVALLSSAGDMYVYAPTGDETHAFKLIYDHITAKPVRQYEERSLLDQLLDTVSYGPVDSQYRDLVQHALDGYRHTARGHERFSTFGESMFCASVDRVMPMVRGKKLFILPMLRELMWMLRGDTDIAYLLRHNVHIWDKWIDPRTARYNALTVADQIHIAEKRGLLGQLADFMESLDSESSEQDLLERKCAWLADNGIPDYKLVGGDLGPLYGAQWRRLPSTQLIFTGDEGADLTYHNLRNAGYEKRGTYAAGDTGYEEIVMHKVIDQLGDVLRLLKSDPGSSRLVVDCWDPHNLHAMQLPPCHMMYQFHTSTDERSRFLHLTAYQRSNDICVGNPFNFASYATLLKLISAFFAYTAGQYVHHMGDIHVYGNQIPGAQELVRQTNAVIEADTEHAYMVMRASADPEQDIMSIMPSLEINIPERFGAGYDATVEDFDAFIAWASELPDDELLEVFKYSYCPGPNIKFPVAV